MNQFLKISIPMLTILILYIIEGCSNNSSPIAQPLPVKKCNIEYDYESIDMWSPSVFSTIMNNKIAVIKAPQNGADLLPLTTCNFPTNSEQLQVKALEDSCFHHRNTSIISYPYYLQIGDSIMVLGVYSDIMGLSNYVGSFYGSTLNYSFVWRANVKTWCDIISTNNFSYALDVVVSHEFGHQIGEMYGPDAHTQHDGSFNCLMWQPNCDSTINQIKRGAGACYCSRHFYKVYYGSHLFDSITNQNGPAVNPVIFDRDLSKDKIVVDSTSNLRVSVQKSEFKKYEPILLRFDYINTHNHIDTIRHTFIDNSDYSLSFFLSSDNKAGYYDRIHDSPFTMFNGPQFFVQPGDTLSLSMVLNHKHGIPFSNSTATAYFDNYGYLEPGDYKFFAEDLIGGTICKTNEISFRISDINDEDKIIWDLVKSGNIEEVYKKYPESIYAEHAFAQHLNDMFTVLPKNINISEVNNEYSEFIKKFPNSLYLLNVIFNDSYVSKISVNSKNVDQIFSIMNPTVENSFYKIFLSNAAVKDRIIRHYHLFK